METIEQNNSATGSVPEEQPERQEPVTNPLPPNITNKFEITQPTEPKPHQVFWKGTIKNTNQKVNIQRLEGAFSSPSSAQKAYRTIKLLKHLKGTPSIAKLLEVIKPSDPESKDLYLVFEGEQGRLRQAVKFLFLQDVHNSYITFALCNVLKHLHSVGIICRNLSTRRLFVNSDCFIKLFSFDNSFTLQSLKDHPAESYALDLSGGDIVGKSNLAPEILLGCPKVGKEVDFWAVGCLLAELCLRKPLFEVEQGESQLKKIMEVVGKPTEEEFQAMDLGVDYSLISDIEVEEGGTFEEKVGDLSSPNALDFVKKCLVFDPSKRITAGRALEHPFLAAFNKGDKPAKLEIPDTKQATVEEYKQALLEDISQ